jgi:L-fucose isomerase-like protein
MDRFTYSVVASPLHDVATVATLTEPVRGLLDELGGRIDDGAGDGDRPHLYVVATGGTERALLEQVARRRTTNGPDPVVLVAHGAHNSLPAALEALAALQQDGRSGRIVYLAGNPDDRDELDRAIVDLETVHRFLTTRLGLVGGPSDWLVASSPAADVVRRRWGPTVEVIAPQRMVELSRSAPAAATLETARRFLVDDVSVDGPVTPASLMAAGAVGVALAEVVEEANVDAVAVRCFDLLRNPGTSGCLALAALNDRGVVAGCEGDLPSTLAMLWIRLLLDQASWMANPARIDATANQIVLAHCTVAPSMTAGLSLSTHFESGIGVGIRGHFEQQAVTLVRVGGRDLDQHWIAEGRIVATGDDACLCRTQVTVELDDRNVAELLARPLGNHLVLAAGRHRDRLEQWWSFAFGA